MSRIAGMTMTVDRLGDLAKNLKALVAKDVLVGVPEAETERDPEPGEPTGITNAAIGYLNEFGSPAANIPARPHLYPGIDDAKDRIVAEQRGAITAALDGDLAGADMRLERMGLIGQASVRNRIITGPFVPLAPSTIAARKRLGHEGEAPLNMSGQYRQAITYVVRK